jgi:hypothetical protein
MDEVGAEDEWGERAEGKDADTKTLALTAYVLPLPTAELHQLSISISDAVSGHELNVLSQLLTRLPCVVASYGKH